MISIHSDWVDYRGPSFTVLSFVMLCNGLNMLCNGLNMLCNGLNVLCNGLNVLCNGLCNGLNVWAERVV